jgi:hypothetical protein
LLSAYCTGYWESNLYFYKWYWWQTYLLFLYSIVPWLLTLTSFHKKCFPENVFNTLHPNPVLIVHGQAASLTCNPVSQLPIQYTATGVSTFQKCINLATFHSAMTFALPTLEMHITLPRNSSKNYIYISNSTMRVTWTWTIGFLSIFQQCWPQLECSSWPRLFDLKSSM